VAHFGEKSYHYHLLAIAAIDMASELDLPRNESNALYERGIRILVAANPASREDWDIIDLLQLGLYDENMARAIKLEEKHSATFYLQEALSVNEVAARKARGRPEGILLGQRALNSRIELIGDLTSLGRLGEAAELRAGLEKSAFLREVQKKDLAE
ncbi:hypothetical protein LY78DRAFT_559386, partial [Colletotrichum sublineola]